jgi:hypothetical protein
VIKNLIANEAKMVHNAGCYKRALVATVPGLLLSGRFIAHWPEQDNRQKETVKGGADKRREINSCY